MQEKVDMKHIIVLFVLILQGCGNNINDAKAEYYCQDKAGLYDYGYNSVTNVIIRCKDGSNHNLSPKEFAEIVHPDVANYLPKEGK